MASHSRSIVGVDELFRRIAFGRNGGKTPDSSIAVACGLILNYFDISVDPRVLPGVFKAELLQGSDWDELRYPRVALLHRYLLRNCHLESGTLWLRGKEVVKRFKQYWQSRPWVIGVIVRAAFGGYGAEKAWSLAQTEVDANRPLMVTMKQVTISGKKLKRHSLAVCGYRVGVLGRRELLVHPGLYGPTVKGSRSQLRYVPLKHVLCSYRFDVVLLNPQV